MGLGHSVPSESEENTVDNEATTSDEKSVQSNPPKRVGKNMNSQENEFQSSDPHQEIVLKFQKLQMDNIIEERNHSERIIREKEKLLKEKEETIRQQADLIKTQNELLGQRKQRRVMGNVGTVKSHHDVTYKTRTAKPLAKHTPFAKSVNSLENIHSNGQDHCNGVAANDDYETKYYGVKPYPPKRQEKPGQTFNAPNPTAGNFSYSSPFQRDSRSTTCTAPYQSTYYTSKNVRPSNSNGLYSTPTSSAQAKRAQNNDYRRNNSKNGEPSDFDNKQPTDELLADLEKQTNYEVQKLDSAQNGDRPLTQVARAQCTFKCSGVMRKNKTSPVGAPPKCKKCCDNISSKSIHRTCRSDDESQNRNVWTSDSEFISDVD